MLHDLPLSPAYVVGIAAIFGLVIGSFLNVVIYRLPLQLELGWKKDARDFLGIDQPEAEQPELSGDIPQAGETSVINIAVPTSHCPECGAAIKPWHNIPVISYLLLNGKCADCKTRIPIQYPLVELITGIVTAFVVYQFGVSAQAFLVLLFSWCLISLTGIDLNRKLLPDNITLPLLWLGLLANTQGLFTELGDAVIGAAAGYLSLWTIYWIFKLLTGKEGMGHGDFKLLAALGAWMGWQYLPMIILLSSLVGATVGIAGILILGRDRQIPIAFGPYLAAAGWIALIWGSDMMGAYLGGFN